MAKTFLMGNEAIALGAIHAGVQLVSGYPGTPSTEVLETVAKENPGHIHVEWSVNEKAALEVAAGASYAGARVMVTMKQVGLNVASDPLMSLVYVGIEGGMVLVVADDPGPISSQTEQDTRHFARFAKLPVFDPSSPEEAYAMVREAFEVSEKYHTPVILRPTTRVCHGCATLETQPALPARPVPGFGKDSSRWVIFPRLSNANHKKIEAYLPQLGKEFCESPFNRLSGFGRRGIAAGGIAYEYLMEALGENTDVRVLKIGTPHPFPASLAVEFMTGLDEVLVLEELDGVIERELTVLCGRYHLRTKILGKASGHAPCAGELSVEIARELAEAFLTGSEAAVPLPNPPPLPVRPPVLCAGCPHRASFYAVKKAMEGKKAVFSGDIGCYTLGNAQPLDMTDTCLCMGAGVTIAQGLQAVEPDAVHFAFIGDSTFFASGITGVVNAVYNQHDMVLVVLDNSTTAMTGLQEHPGTGRKLDHSVAPQVIIEDVIRAMGVDHVDVIDPNRQDELKALIEQRLAANDTAVIIARRPCLLAAVKIKSYSRAQA